MSSQQRYVPLRYVLPICVIAAVILLSPAIDARWVYMWILAFCIYLCCKWITWISTQTKQAPIWKKLAYLFGWPGLNAQAFLFRHAEDSEPKLGRYVWAAIKVFGGISLFFASDNAFPTLEHYWLGWLGMIGVVMGLHFGLFELLALYWQRCGIAVTPIMQQPLRSTSLSEFWGVRWNTAFRDLTHKFCFRPLTNRIGPVAGIMAGFLFSGLVHDLVISYPAEGGYGGPTLYFLIQGVGLVFSRSRWGQALGLRRGWTGWGYTMSILLLPLHWLFHPTFIQRIVLPMMQDLGAIT